MKHLILAIALLAGCADPNLYCDTNADCPPGFYCDPGPSVCVLIPNGTDAGTDAEEPGTDTGAPMRGPRFVFRPPIFFPGTDAGTDAAEPPGSDSGSPPSDSGSDSGPPSCTPLNASHGALCGPAPAFVCPADGAYVCASVGPGGNTCYTECDPAIPTCCDGSVCQPESAAPLGGVCATW